MRGVIVLMLFCVIFLVACQSVNTQEPHQGRKGLEVRFTDYSQRSVIEKNPLTIGVSVTNHGAEKVENGILVISAQEDFFNEYDGIVPLNLDGKVDTLTNVGQSHVQTLNIETKAIFASESRQTDILASVCYPYKTVFSTPVCIDTDYLNQNPSKPSECPPRAQSFNGQGAPVAIVRVEPSMIPSNEGDTITPMFTFTVANVDRGSVYHTSEVERACSSRGISPQARGIVDVNNIFLGSNELRCTTDRFVVDTTEEYYETTQIRCVGDAIPITIQPYIGSLTATLNYGYMSSQTHSVTISRVQ